MTVEVSIIDESCSICHESSELKDSEGLFVIGILKVWMTLGWKPRVSADTDEEDYEL